MPTLKSNDFRLAKKTKTIVYVFVLAFMHPLLIKAQQPARLSGFSALQKGFETPPDSVRICLF